MSKKFDVDAYVSRWDNILIPVMLVFIVASMIGVYAMNVLLRPDCTTHDYVYCSTPLTTYEEAGEGSHGEAGEGHGPAGGPHAPAGDQGAPAGEEAAHGHPH